MVFMHNYYTGAIIEGPSNVTYLPGLTSLPIKLTCNVTGATIWRVNGSYYFPEDFTSGLVPGHNATGVNILITRPVNNTEYICVSLQPGVDARSDPAYTIIAGKNIKYFVLHHVHIHIYVATCVCIIIVYATTNLNRKIQDICKDFEFEKEVGIEIKS